MKIIFQSKTFDYEKILKKFSLKNKYSGSIISFLGKVRKFKGKTKIESIDIEFYKKMAVIQAKKAITALKKKVKIDDILIIHRYGNLKPGENIIIILVASKHRNKGFVFIQEAIIFFKKKITFWKKENFLKSSKWVKAGD